MQQAKHHLWQHGTQPILLLVAYGHWSHLDPMWNQDGKGSSDVKITLFYIAMTFQG
jgi:hypothetical protein